MSGLSVVTECYVAGLARTKGSMTHVGNGRMVESVAGSKTWRRLVSAAVRSERVRRLGEGCKPSHAALSFRLAFFLDGALDDVAWLVREGTGDIDKLTRNVLDALQDEFRVGMVDSGAVVNDSQFQRGLISKYGCPAGETPGVLIQVWERTDGEVSIEGRAAYADVLQLLTGQADPGWNVEVGL